MTIYIRLVSFAYKAVLVSLAVINFSANAQPQSTEISSDVKDLLNFYERKIYFTENKGQWDSEIRFRAEFPLGKAIATPLGMLVTSYHPQDMAMRFDYGIREEQAHTNNEPFSEQKINVKAHSWLLAFKNASPLMSIESKVRHSDVFNYFTGNPERFRTDVKNYDEVWYRNVYENVDVRYYPSHDGMLEYDIICKPGFEKEQIAIQFEGIAAINMGDEGSLVLHTSVGDMILPSPIAYQKINGEKTEVKTEYVISDENIISFNIAEFDKAQTLIIDPIALRWATWLNSSSTGDNHGHCVWVDPDDGAIYTANRLVGTTDNIVPGGFSDTASGGIETVVGKYLEPQNVGGSGTRLWQTYIGGSGNDNPFAMEQSPDGNLYITGTTNSYNFPLLGGPAFSGSSIDNRLQNNSNVYVLKINQSGNSVKSSVIGGNGGDNPYDLRISDAGEVFVCGSTSSNNLDSLHPGLGAINSSNPGSDVLLLKINADLSALSWLRNYGGTQNDQAKIMLLNHSTEELFVAGHTESIDFPLQNPRQNYFPGSYENGFVQKLHPDGSIQWSSYFNSDSMRSTHILCMEFNATNSALYFAGLTSGLNSTNEFSSGVFDNTMNMGESDFFLASMDTAQNLFATTYLGGSGDEGNMMGLNVDPNNDVFIFGYSNSTDFPVSPDALQNINMGGSDKVFLKISHDLSTLKYSTYFGGSSDDFDPVGERGIKFSNCRIYTIVTAQSFDIPLTQGAITDSRASSDTSFTEPGLVVWANPPDLTNNTIFEDQVICAGSIPEDILGTVPTFSLPSITRNGIVTTYPSIGTIISYQWQSSTDGINWINIPGATAQNLPASLIGPLFSQTFFRRIISGDACTIEGLSGQIVTVTVPEISETITAISCAGSGNGVITASVINGTPPFTYLWNTGATTSSLSGLSPGTYSLTITDASSCSVTENFDVDEPDTLAVSVTSSGGNCLTGAVVNAVVSGGTAPYYYIWSQGGETTSSIAVSQTGDYSVNILDSNNCAVASQSFHVEISSSIIPSITANGSLEFCQGENVTLIATSSDSLIYQWFQDGVEIQGQTDSIFIVSESGAYSVEITDVNGCTGESQITEVSVSQIPVAVAGSDETICSGEQLILTASGGDNYVWSNGETTQSITVSPSQETDYVVIVSNSFCNETDIDTIQISITPFPFPLIAISDNPSLGNPVNFSDVSGDSTIVDWLWDFGDGSNSSTPNSHHIYTDEGSYTVILTAENQYGCFASDTVDIVIEQTVTVPGIITPNGDGFNDAIYISNNGVEQYHIIIYNRWGQVIFSAKEKAILWDGTTVAGERVSEGTYFYILEAVNTGSLGDFKKSGFITLVR